MARAEEGAGVGPLGGRWAGVLPGDLRDLGQTYGAAAALVLLVLYNAVFTDRFLTTDSVYVNLTQVAPIVIAINSSSDANQVGLNVELAAIAAVAVGGTPLTGGRATVTGTLIGALILQLLRFTLLSHGVPDAVALVIQAVIIVAAVFLQRQRQT